MAAPEGPLIAPETRPLANARSCGSTSSMKSTSRWRRSSSSDTRVATLHATRLAVCVTNLPVASFQHSRTSGPDRVTRSGSWPPSCGITSHSLIYRATRAPSRRLGDGAQHRRYFRQSATAPRAPFNRPKSANYPAGPIRRSSASIFVRRLPIRSRSRRAWSSDSVRRNISRT
jgi:hypothetical protein